MNSLFYLIRRAAVNSLRDLLKKPGKLILYLVVILALGGSAVASVFVDRQVKEPAPLFILQGILFAFVAVFVVVTVIKGNSSGDNIFEMSDVNLLFVSPVSPRTILLYGILRSMKGAFLACFFILFQVSNLAQFGVGFGGAVIILLFAMLSITALSVLSLIIYNYSNSNPRRKRGVKTAAAALFLPVAVLFAAEGLRSGDLFGALAAAIQSPMIAWFPVAGWAAAGATRLLAGDLSGGGMFAGALLLFLGLLVGFLLISKTDYYEDALVGSETAYERRRAIQQGNLNGTAGRGRKIKVQKTGIAGIGASAIFYKHLRESGRENRFGFLGLPSLLLAAGAIALSGFVRNIMITLLILMYLQIFMIGTGRGLKETFSHYIYMIPERSLSKIIWSSMEVMFKTLIESALIFGAGGVLAGANVGVILASVAAYTLYAFLLLGVNYLSMRVTGADISAGLLILIYFLGIALIIAPGAAGALVAGFALGGDLGIFVGLLILAGWELLAGLGCFSLSKSVLDHSDMSVVRTR